MKRISKITMETKDEKRISQKQIQAFHKKIFDFYNKHKRDLPWRKTRNLYYIMVSEVMLQQTQVPRVIDKYNEWIKTFPTIQELAEAPLEKVLKAWNGLGFNSRGKRLHDAAKIIQKQHKEKIPQTPEELETLPGIGPYTSRAILIFANNKDLATVDTNIRRIFIHEFKLDEKISDKELKAIAEKVLPKGRSRDWHNALMDYGTTILTARKSGIKSKGKQSKFKGSRREIRARILKHILDKKTITKKQAEKFFPETTHKIDEILEELMKEELITKTKENKYTIRETK